MADMPNKIDPLQSDEDRQRYLLQMSADAESTFWGFLGCKVENAEAGRATISLDVKPHHLNVLGIIHGGVLSTLLDNVMGIAVMMARPNEKVVTTNLNVHFVSSLKGGTLLATAEIVHQSRKIMTATGTITGDGGGLTAMGTGSFRVI